MVLLFYQRMAKLLYMQHTHTQNKIRMIHVPSQHRLERGYSQDSMQTRHICTDIFSTLMRVIWVKPVMLFA